MAKRHAQALEPAVVDAPRALDSPYLTAHEALIYLRLNTLSTLYHHIRENRLPTLRRGGRYLFDRRELDAWVRGAGSALELARKRSA